MPEDKWAEVKVALWILVDNLILQVIKMQLGLYVGERLLICKELSQFDFIIPLQKPFSRGTDKTLIYPAVGEYFHFSAIWSMQHNGFLIYELQPVPLLRQHVTSVNGNVSYNIDFFVQNIIFISAPYPRRSCQYQRSLR